MKILRNYLDNNIVINNEVDFHADAGWEENLADFEKEVLYDIINPIENFETVRYIHLPYSSSTGVDQTDIWYKFYFLTTGATKEYVQDYTPTGITLEENIKHLAQFYKSFFRLEFFKTPHILDVSGNTIGYEPPTRINRKMVFAKNLPVTTSMKYFYLDQNATIHVPVFFGSNYVNKENMYQFWFQDETVLNETNLSGTTTFDKYSFTNTGSTSTEFRFIDEKNNDIKIQLATGQTVVKKGVVNQVFDIEHVNVTYYRDFYPGMNTFFMTAKFYNTKDGSIIDFVNDKFCSVYEITEEKDMYFQVEFNKVDHTYEIFNYHGTTKGNRVGQPNNPIMFYEKGGRTICLTPTPTPTPTATHVFTTHTPTPTPTHTPTLTLTPTPTSGTTYARFSFELGFSEATARLACDNYNPETNTTYWSYCSTLENSCYLYTVGDSPLSGVPPEGYYSDGTNSFYVINGYMVGKAVCTIPPTPTPTLPPVAIGIYTGTTFSTAADACTSDYYPNSQVYIYHGDTLSNGDILYQQGMMNPFNGNGNGTYYILRKNGTIYAAKINLYGEVSDLFVCQ